MNIFISANKIVVVIVVIIKPEYRYVITTQLQAEDFLKGEDHTT